MFLTSLEVHAPSQEVLPTAPPEPPKAATPPPVTEPTPVIETAPGWTAEDDGCLLEIHRIGVLLAGKQGIKERYKQLTKDDAAKTNDAAEKVEEKAPVEEPATEWTAEDDEQMAKLKKEKKSWKEIEDALGGKKGAKARYKEVNKDAAAGNDTDNEAEEKSKGPSKSNSLVMTDDELERTPSFSGQAIKPVVRLEDGEELSYDEARIYVLFCPFWSRHALANEEPDDIPLPLAGVLRGREMGECCLQILRQDREADRSHGAEGQTELPLDRESTGALRTD